MLVEKGIFKKLKLGFLLVGHTHDHIDQMSSRFSIRLQRKEAWDGNALQEILISSYVPQPCISEFHETMDFKRFVFGGRKSEHYIAKLNDQRFQHQSRKEKDANERTLLWGKLYSFSSSWLPNDGLSFLKFIPNRVFCYSKKEIGRAHV